MGQEAHGRVGSGAGDDQVPGCMHGTMDAGPVPVLRWGDAGGEGLATPPRKANKAKQDTPHKTGACPLRLCSHCAAAAVVASPPL